MNKQDSMFQLLFGMNQGEFENALSSYLQENMTETKSKRDEIAKYTDKDFEDDEKLVNFLNETDALLDDYDRLSPLTKKLVNSICGSDWTNKLQEWQEHAIEVNGRSHYKKAIKNLFKNN